MMNSFITTLLTIINSSSTRDNDYRIARCLLEKNKDIENMSIKELASECQVAQATLNRFLIFYGFQKYSLFRNTYLQHIKIRLTQMLERYNEWKKKPENAAILKNFLSKEEYLLVSHHKNIMNCVEKIHQSQRIILIGSDEMIYHTLRFQGDLTVMGKVVLKSSLYKNAFITPEKDDFVFLLSMTGRIIDLNSHLLSDLMQNNPHILTIGYYDYLKNKDMSLIIPKGKSEIEESVILEYYLENILYTYMETYYVDR